MFVKLANFFCRDFMDVNLPPVIRSVMMPESILQLVLDISFKDGVL